MINSEPKARVGGDARAVKFSYNIDRVLADLARSEIDFRPGFPRNKCGVRALFVSDT